MRVHPPARVGATSAIGGSWAIADDGIDPTFTVGVEMKMIETPPRRHTNCAMQLPALMLALALFPIGDAIAQSWQRVRGDDGVVHNLEDRQTRPLTITTEPAMSASEPSRPPQPLGDVAEAELSSTEMADLSQAEASYAAYEEKDLQKDANDAYIPQSVIGEDQRSPEADTRKWPGSAVVQISFRVREGSSLKACSGAMIAPDVLLTAGHCVYSQGAQVSNGTWHRDFTIYPGRSKEHTPFGRCGAKQLFSVGGWVNGVKNSESAKLHDIAAIKLDCEVGHRSQWFTMVADERPVGAGTVVRGYPQEPAKFVVGTQVKSPDKIRHRMDLKVFYQNDTFGGMSGSPVFSTATCPFDEPSATQCRTVFAVHTNGLHCCGVWQKNNAGTQLTTARIRNIRAWIERR